MEKLGIHDRHHCLCAVKSLERISFLVLMKFTEVWGKPSLACHCGRVRLKVYPTSRWKGARWAQSGAEGSILAASSLWPRAALSTRPPLFVPAAERAAPMSPLERNEKKERTAAVTWALLFHSPRSPWQRGRGPGSTQPLLSRPRPGGKEAAGSFPSWSLLTVSWRKKIPTILVHFKCTEMESNSGFAVFRFWTLKVISWGAQMWSPHE